MDFIIYVSVVLILDIIAFIYFWRNRNKVSKTPQDMGKVPFFFG